MDAARRRGSTHNATFCHRYLTRLSGTNEALLQRRKLDPYFRSKLFVRLADCVHVLDPLLFCCWRCFCTLVASSACTKAGSVDGNFAPQQGVVVISIVDVRWAEHAKQSLTHWRRSGVCRERGGDCFFNKCRERMKRSEFLRFLEDLGLKREPMSCCLQVVKRG